MIFNARRSKLQMLIKLQIRKKAGVGKQCLMLNKNGTKYVLCLVLWVSKIWFPSWSSSIICSIAVIHV